MVKISELIEKEYEARKANILRQLTHTGVSLSELEKLLVKKKDSLADYKPKFIIEKKYNGFRALIHRKGNIVKIYSDQARDITAAFPTIVNQAKKLTDADFILDCELVPYKGTEPLGRDIAAKYIGAVKSKKKVEDYNIVFFVFDCLYYNKDITGLPLYERKKTLHSLNFTDNIREAGTVVVDDRESALKAIKMFKDMKGSEGAVIKEYDGKYYPAEESKAWIKYRVLLELKVVVLKVNELKGTTAQNYAVGIYLSKEEAEKINSKYIVLFRGKPVHILGNTFNTKKRAAEGDIIGIQVEEVWRHKHKDGTVHYSLHKPHVIGKMEFSKSSKISDLDAMVVSRGVEVEMRYLPEETPEAKKATGEGGTRSAKAEKFWAENWHKQYPKSGSGGFVYQHHWRGLNKDETKLSDEELMNTDHSVHGDLRFEIDSNRLFGFTVFLGETKDNRNLEQKDKLIEYSKAKNPQKKLQGAWKLEQPHQWMNVGKKTPYVSGPGESGATTERYAKFFAKDSGTYRLGVWRQHFFELFLNGKHLKGRCIIAYAPVGGSRRWLISFPKDQTPYAETHRVGEVVKELRSKGQKYLIWCKPGCKPTKIDVQKGEKA